MKKYIVSILVASVFLIGTPFLVPKVSAADLNIRDFVNLLIAIGVITPDKLPMVNAFLATLNNPTPVTTVSPAPTLTLANYVMGKDTGVVTGTGLLTAKLYFNGSVVNPSKYTYVTDSQISFIMPTYNDGTYPVYVKSDNGKSNTVYLAVGSTVATSTPVTPTVTEPLTTVLSPNGGEKYNIGSAVLIRWSALNLPAQANNKVSISLAGFNSSGELVSIQSLYPAVYGGGNGSVSNSGSSLWTVPSTVNPGNRYKIRINGDCQTCFSSDDSNDYFTITSEIAPPTTVVPPVTTVKENMTYISPIGGTYQTGSVLPIRLSVTGFTPDRNSSQSIQLYNSSSFLYYIASNHAWTSSLDWEIPANLPAGEYTLLINGGGYNGGNGFSVRSQPFTISASSGGELGALVNSLISKGLIAQDKISAAKAAVSTNDLNMTKVQLVELFISNRIITSDKANQARLVVGIETPACSSFIYSDWSMCGANNYGYQDRKIVSSLPISCQGGNPVLRKICEPTTSVVSTSSTSCNSTGDICVIVNSPTEGENLRKGDPYRIKWTSTPNVDQISIGYSFGSGSLNWIANGISNSGYYDWNIDLGNTANTKARIQIIGYDTGVGSVTAYSNGYFNLTQ
jgi:hypothetical protein